MNPARKSFGGVTGKPYATRRSLPGARGPKMKGAVDVNLLDPSLYEGAGSYIGNSFKEALWFWAKVYLAPIWVPVWLWMRWKRRHDPPNAPATTPRA
jgi:hypothetical protein